MGAARPSVSQVLKLQKAKEQAAAKVAAKKK
jgi:hypothetical protein